MNRTVRYAVVLAYARLIMENFNNLLKIDTDTNVEYFKKRTILQRKGDLKAKSFYVKKGLLRSYLIDSKGKEHVYLFAPEGWIIADLEASEFNEPVALFIDCIEDSEVIIFDKDSLFRADLPKATILENTNLLYRRLGMLQRRVLMLMSSPAIDRYIYFIKIHPELSNRVPQHMIATYLGITPQALSKIRGELARTKSPDLLI